MKIIAQVSQVCTRIPRQSEGLLVDGGCNGAGDADAERRASLVGTFSDYVDNARQRDEPTYTSRWAHPRRSCAARPTFAHPIRYEYKLRETDSYRCRALRTTLVTGRKGLDISRWKPGELVHSLPHCLVISVAPCLLLLPNSSWKTVQLDQLPLTSVMNIHEGCLRDSAAEIDL